METGIIRQLPSGEFIEETRPVSEEKRAALVFRSKPPGLPSSGEEDENGVPAPQMRGALGKVRARLYNIVTESAELEPSHGNGHGMAWERARGGSRPGRGDQRRADGHRVRYRGGRPARVLISSGGSQRRARRPGRLPGPFA